MALMPWKDEYSVKIGAIDEQHKKLVDLLNQVHEATLAGRGKLVVGNILSELLTYTKVHFAAEEELMKKHAYPELNSHRAEHDELVRKVEEFKQKHAAGRVTMSVEIMQFLMDWLTEHILGVDKRYSAFLNGKGVS